MITFEDIKPIRNRLRKFDRDALIQLAAEQLHATYHEPTKLMARWLPWYLMLLVKWALVDELQSADRRRPTIDDLTDLRNRMWRLGERARPPSQYGSIYGFLRAMAFQQFWYHRQFAANDLARQAVLFGKLAGSGQLAARFEAVAGISLSDYLELCFALGARFLGNSSVDFTANWFSPLLPRYGAARLNRFLGMLSADYAAAGEIIRQSDARVRDLDARMYEQTPLRKRPLLALPGKYICYSPSVLFDRLTTGTYDLLKEADGEAFTREFGDVFEEYLGALLVEHACTTLRERELRRLYPGAKMPDFVIQSEDATIVVESKAVEMSPLAQVSPDPAVVNNYLRSSIIKGICQAHQVAERIVGQPPAGFSRSKSEFFVLVVTFKDLFIGSGEDFIVNDVAREIREFDVANRVDDQLVPAQNVFFLAVQEFEWLLATCAHHGRPLATVLRAAVVANREPMGKKFNLWQHVEEQFPGGIRSVASLGAAFDELVSRIGFIGE